MVQIQQAVESSKVLVQRKISDAEINRSTSSILKRLKAGSDTSHNNMTEFHAILCKDGKIRLSRWHTNGMGLSRYQLTGKLFDLWVDSVSFRTRSGGWYNTEEKILTKKQIIFQLKKARKRL